MSDHKNSLELWTLGQIQRIDVSARRSRASGASLDRCDITSKYFHVECKQQLTKEDVTLTQLVYNKLIKEVGNSPKVYFWIFENKSKYKWVILDDKIMNLLFGSNLLDFYINRDYCKTKNFIIKQNTWENFADTQSLKDMRIPLLKLTCYAQQIYLRNIYVFFAPDFFNLIVKSFNKGEFNKSI